MQIRMFKQRVSRVVAGLEESEEKDIANGICTARE